MTAVVDLTELAKRVEGLAGPDREVDGLIACAIFKTVMTDDDLIYLSPICKSDECAPGTYWLVQRSGRSLQTAPTYTASLDAAMSLVPEGYVVDGLTVWPKEGCSAKILGTHQARDGRYWHNHKDGFWVGEAATPALALTAAVLRARLQDAAHD